MRRLTLTTVLEDIRSRRAADAVCLVGVDGGGGSGKSTLARRLAELADAPLLEVDDFIAWGDITSWWDRFVSEALAPLRESRDARFQVRDWEHDEFGSGLNGWKTVHAAPLVIVEGISCTRAAVAAWFAYRIWVDTPEEVRLQRGLERDGQTHKDLWLDWLAMERQFFARDDTRSRADLVVCGSADLPNDALAEVVVAASTDTGCW